VIFWTAIALLPRLRNTEIAETRLFWGPLSKFVTRYFNWFIIDIIVSVISVFIAASIWRTSIPLNIGWQNAIWVSLIISSVFGMFNYIFGLNRVSWSRAAATDVLLLGISAIFSTVFLVVFKQLFLSATVLPVGMILTAGFLSFIGFVLARYRERLLTGAASRWVNLRQGAAHIAERVLIVGAGDNGELAIWLLNRSTLANVFSVYGILDDDPRKQGMRINGVDVLGTTDQIADIVKKHDIGLIIYTIYNIADRNRKKLIKICQKTNARVVVLPDIMRSLHEADDTFKSFEGESNHDEDQLLTNAWLDGLVDLAESGDIQSLLTEIHKKKTDVNR
jgi:FlaA1/EpsC-like NDP-sugar epimerase